MSYANDTRFLTFKAAENLTAFQFRAMRISAEGIVNVASNVAANQFVGILASATSSGQNARVAVGGVSRATAGGNITAGALVTHTASGFITAAASGNLVIGRALTTAAANELVSVQLAEPSYFAAIGV